MQPATRFLARVKRNNKYVFQKVAIKRDRPVAPKDATSYYARYSNPTGRVTAPLGTDLERAYVAFLNLESANKKVRAGQAAPVITVTDDVALTDAIEEYLETAEESWK